MSVSLQDKRRQANKELLEILTKVVNSTDGHLRFSQILAGYSFVKDVSPFDAAVDKVKSTSAKEYWRNEFYKEPDEVLERVKKAYEKIEGD